MGFPRLQPVHQPFEISAAVVQQLASYFVNLFDERIFFHGQNLQLQDNSSGVTMTGVGLLISVLRSINLWITRPLAMCLQFQVTR
jgi:Na+-transporting NADH:ubiquinone oxidoreductase subunit NqrA